MPPPSRRRRAPSGARDNAPGPVSRPSSPSSGGAPSAGDAAEGGDSQEHYTYQEMVDHLRKVRSTSGEQGLKSKKKRRRRTHQPLHEKRRRRLFMLATFLLVLLPILTFVFGSFLFSYMAYKGERFRRDMSVSVSETLGVKGEFEHKFDVSRLTVKNRKFSATGPTTSPVAAFELTNVESRLRPSSFFSKEWSISNLVADRATFHLRPLTPQAPAAAPAAMVEEVVKLLAAGIGFSGVPDSYNADRISCRHFNANFGANLDLVHRLEGLHVTMNRTRQGYFATIDRGKLKYFYWPEFTVETADLTFGLDGRMVIHGAKLTTENDGICALSGEITFVDNPSINVTAELTNIKVDNMVNETWRERSLGRLEGEMKIEGSLSMDQLPAITGKIKIPGLAVKNLPLLTSLAVHCKLGALKRIEFDTFEADFRQEGNRIAITNIYGNNPSLAGLTGNVTIEPNHNIQGAFELGLSDATLDGVTTKEGVKKRPAFFKPKGDGTFSWAAFDVTGSLETPIDNLDRQFQTYFEGNYDSREHRRASTFRRPLRLRDGPQEVYRERLRQLFDRYVN